MIHETIKIQAEGSAYEGKLVTYFLGNSPEIEPDRRRPVVVICPGGAYSATSDREAEGIAMQFLGRGYHAAVLRYSTAPARFQRHCSSLHWQCPCFESGQRNGTLIRTRSWCRVRPLAGTWQPALAYSGRRHFCLSALESRQRHFVQMD